MGLKRAVALLLAVLTVAFLASCTIEKGVDSSDDISNETSEIVEISETSEEEKKVLWISDVADFSAYVKLGQYMGVIITKQVLTDNDVENKIKELMESLKEYKDIGVTRAAKLGDVVIIDYKGYRKDTGVAFKGGEATDTNLELGSNKFIPGFEEQIVGHFAGESFDIELSFPESYHEETLAGQPVKFEIVLKTVKEETYPELTDETAKSLNYETADKLRVEARTQAERDVYLQNLQNAWDAVVENATVSGYPQEYYDYTLESFIEYYFSYYEYLASMYGMKLEEYVGMTEEEFRADLEIEGKKYTESYLTEEMIMYSIADNEFGRELTKSEITEKIEEYAEKEGVTVEEIKEKYEEKSLNSNILWDKVLVYIFENAVYASEDIRSGASTD